MTNISIHSNTQSNPQNFSIEENKEIYIDVRASLYKLCRAMMLPYIEYVDFLYHVALKKKLINYK